MRARTQEQRERLRCELQQRKRKNNSIENAVFLVYNDARVKRSEPTSYNNDSKEICGILRRKIKMAAVKELLRAESDGTLSFGDYTLASKTKKDNYEFEGDLYKVKTFSEITKLEKNGMFVYESVPGSAVENFRETDKEVAFTVSAPSDVQFTLELEPESEYEVFLDGASAGRMSTNLSGKLSVSVELSADQSAEVKVVKC